MQKVLRIDRHDVDAMVGKFIVSIDDEDFNNDIIVNDEVDLYWVEKRISQVALISEKESQYLLVGFFYPHSKPLTIDELVEEINKGIEGRHYRFMTLRELELSYSCREKIGDDNWRAARERSIKRDKKRKA